MTTMLKHLIFAVPFLLLCILSSQGAYGEEGPFLEVSFASLNTSINCSSHREPSSNSMMVTSRYGPCSQLPADGQSVNLKDLLDRDEVRVAALQRSLLNTSDAEVGGPLHASIPARKGIPLNTANYVISIGLGTPRRTQTVMFETATTLSWVQCLPCATFCYSQSEPIFNPSSSSTYKKFQCNSDQCYLLPRRGCTANTCIYGVEYADQSSSTGYLSQDTLTLTSSDVFSRFIFGCGQNNQGFLGRAAGIVGLSRGPLSLVSQTSNKLGKIFSYCLPTTTAVGDLTLGPTPKGGTIYYTKMLTDSRDPSLYFLELTSISVGNQKLPISQTVFRNAGTLIDSGTVITRLPKTAYAALRDEFRKGMTKYKRTNAMGVLDTCYDLTGVGVAHVPKVSFSFGGGTKLDLGFLNIMVMAPDAAHTCLAFAGNADDVQVGIIGNVQQASFRVVYDLASSRIGFGGVSCS